MSDSRAEATTAQHLNSTVPVQFCRHSCKLDRRKGGQRPRPFRRSVGVFAFRKEASLPTIKLLRIQPEQFSVSDAARVVNVNPATLRAWIRRGLVRHVVLPGGGWRIPRAEVERLTSSQSEPIAV